MAWLLTDNDGKDIMKSYKAYCHWSHFALLKSRAKRDIGNFNDEKHDYDLISETFIAVKEEMKQCGKCKQKTNCAMMLFYDKSFGARCDDCLNANSKIIEKQTIKLQAAKTPEEKKKVEEENKAEQKEDITDCMMHFEHSWGCDRIIIHYANITPKIVDQWRAGALSFAPDS